MPPIRNYADALNIKALIQSAVLGVTNTGNTGVDMGTCRSGVLQVSFTKGTDVATTFSIQDSADNGVDDDWADVITLTDAQLASTALVLKEIPRMKRYLRVKWVRSAANGDSYWSVVVAGKYPQVAPV